MKVTFSRLAARTLHLGVISIVVGGLGAFIFLGLGPFNPDHLLSLIFPMTVTIIAAPILHHTLLTQKIEISNSRFVITNAIPSP